jgi:hypothetical protein
MERPLDREIHAELTRLVGTRLTSLGRAANLQWFALTSASGQFDVSLHVLCPWRLRTETELLIGSRDYWRPASAGTPTEAFDRGRIGATWCDVRTEAVRNRLGETTIVERVEADPLGGFVLMLSAGVRLEVCPDASHAPHDEIEFWRLFTDEEGSENFVVSSDGIDRVAEA